MPKITLNPFSPSSIQKVIDQVREYQKKVEKAGAEIAKELADLGYQVAYGIMSGHVFSGETSESLEVKKVSDNQYILYAASKAILFFEFGAGVAYADTDHPWASDFGYGPGTYPGNGHWDDPQGWWFPTDDPRLIVYTSKKTGKSYGHSYGNKPHMPFYKADQAMIDNLVKIAKKVLTQ